MYPSSIIFLGAGPAAREFFWFFHDQYPEAPVAFVDDVTPKMEHVIGGVSYPVVKDWDFTALRRAHAGLDQPFTHFLLGVSEPPIKKTLVEKALAHGLVPAPTLITPDSLVRPDCTVGRGGLIIQSIMTTAVQVGDYLTSIVSTYGSDVRIGDYVTSYAGCRVASDVVLEDGVSLGAGTVVRERARLAPWVVTGQCTCVVKSIDEPGITVVGLPARQISRTEAG